MTMHRIQRILFATTNHNKLKKAREVLNTVEVKPLLLRNLEIQEIQTINHKDLITHKLRQLIEKNTKKPVLVDDFGLYIDDLGGFPSTYTKLVLKQLGLKKLLRLADGMKAELRCYLGLHVPGDKNYFCCGVLLGRIKDTGRSNVIDGAEISNVFVPEGQKTPLSELGPDFPDHRYLALIKLRKAVPIC